MPTFQNISLERRLRHVITLTSAIALTLACVAICVFQFVASRREAVHELTSVAKLIEANSTAALALQDAKAAVEILETLKTNPDVLSARIYESDGRLFAQYVRAGAAVPPPSPEHLREGYWFDNWQLILSHHVLFGNQTVGTVVLRSDLQDQFRQLRYYVTIVAILMLASTCTAFLLSTKLQDTISGPILELARVARGITEKKDYSLRAEGKRKDEVGLLIDAFNQMLDQIQERDAALRKTYAELEEGSHELEAELAERQRAEERFRQLAESISEVFWMTNTEKTQMVYISPAYEKVWGRTCESLYKAPLTWVEAIHPEDRERVLRAALAKQTNGTYDEEYRIVRPSGAIRWIRDRAFPILDDQGKPYRIAGIAEDITAYKLAEEELRLQGEITRNMDEGVLLVRANDAVIVYVNPKFERMFGYEPGELKDKPTSVLTAENPSRAEENMQEIMRALNKSGRWSGELLNRRKDGTEFWTYATISGFEHRDYGRVRISVETDITEQKRAAVAVEKLAAIVESTEDAILSASPHGVIESWNPSAERMYGYSAKEAIGQPITILASPDRKDEPISALKRVLAGERIKAFETVRRRKDGTLIPVSLTLSSIRDRDGRMAGASSIARDITERKLAEQKLRQTEEKYRLLVERVPAITYIAELGPSGRWHYISPQVETLLGFSPEQWMADRNLWFRQVHPDDRAVALVADERSRGSGRHSAEYRLLARDGRVVWCRDEGVVVQGGLGETPLLQGVIYDITERKLAELQLTTLGHAVESTDQMICITDLQDRFTFVNRAFWEGYGYSEAEIIGKTPEILFSPRNPPSLIAEILRQTRLGGWRGEVLDRRKDGTEFPVFLSTSQVKNSAGQVIGLMGVAQDITERKRALEALAQAEEKFRSIFEGAQEGIFQTTPDGRVLTANPAMARMLGYDSVEDLTTSITDMARQVYVESERRSKLKRLIDAHGVTHIFELQMYRKDGQKIWVSFDAHVVRDAGGAVLYYEGTARDITERKLAEFQLTTLAHAVEGTDELICITDLQDRFIFVNRAFEKVHGYKKEEILGKTPVILHSPRIPPSLAAEISEQTRLGGWRGEVLDRRKDGTEFPVFLSTSLVKDPNGQVIGLMGVAQDITERKRAEEAIRKTEHRLHAIIDNSTAVIYLKDRDGKYILINHQYETLFHITRDKIVGKTDHDVFPSEAADKFRENDLRVLAERKPLQFEEVAPHEDGMHTYVSVKFPFLDSTGEAYAVCGISTDITERIQAEQVMRAQQQEQQAILNSVPALIWYKDCHNRIIRLNQSAAASIGKTVAEMEGRRVEELYPDEAAKYYRDDLEVINSGQPKLGIVEQLLTASGEKRWIQTDKVPFFNERGEIIGLIVCSVDITERKQIEQALQTQARVLENMVEGVLVYDEHERILLTNSALDAMFGYARGELIGKLTFVLNPFPPETGAQIAMEIRSHLETQPSLQREFLNRRKDGTEFVSESRVSKLQIDGQWCQVAVVQDVTKRKRMEKEIVEISDREQRRIGQDLHDGLSQLLTGTAFAGKVLEERLAAKSLPETSQAAKVVALLEQATSESRRVARGLHPVQLEAGGLPSALQELANSVQALFGVACKFTCPDPVPIQGTAAATHVYRIAQEAVNNAVRHSGAKQITISLTQRRDTLTLAVADDGKGLPERPIGGTGMGMSIMAYRAQMIGGTFQVERRTKGGTRVACSFKIE